MAKKKHSPNEDRELEQAYADLTGRDISHTKKESGKILPILAGCLLAAAVLAGCALSGGIGQNYTEPSSDSTAEPSAESTTSPTAQPVLRVSEGVVAAGKDLSGMTRDELEAALADISLIYESVDMVVRIDEAEYTLPAAHTGAALDVSAAADAIWEAAPGEFDLSPYLLLDTEYILSYLAEWDTIHTTAGKETTWTIEGEMPSLKPLSEEPACQTLVLTKGIAGRILDCDALYQQILAGYQDRSFLAQVQTSSGEAENFDITPIYEQYYIAPVDAVMNMSTFNVTSETYGYGFDADAAQTAWDSAEEGTEIRVEFTRVAPAVTGESLSSILYRDVLGTYSTAHTNNANRNNNLKLACKALNGLILYPGETFSYNQTLGERTTEKGYLPAGAYSSGGVVESVGGGICQVSSTLYYAVLKADLKIVYRANHGMTVAYVPLGLDATVDWGLVDFKFKNSSNYPIKIEAYVSGGYVTIKIIGTDERNYDVKMFYEVNETYPFETIYREMYADNEDGYKDGDVIVSPYTGYKVTTYRCKYDRETGALISRTQEAVSTYRKVDQVIAKIIEKPTEPEETEPAPTEHVHDHIASVTAPTCTENGYTVYTCPCGDTYRDNIVAAHGHTWSEWITTKAPTTESEGSMEHECTVCKTKETQTIEKLPAETEPAPTETEPIPSETEESVPETSEATGSEE